MDDSKKINYGNKNEICCEEILEKLSFFAEHELDESDDKLVKDHLVECVNCTGIVEDFDILLKDLHTMNTINLPEGFNERLHNSLQSIKPNQRQSRFNLRKISAIAAVFIVGIMSVQMYGLVNNQIDKTEQYTSKIAAPTTLILQDQSNMAAGVNQDGAASGKMSSYGVTNVQDTAVIGLIADKMKNYHYDIIDYNIETSEYTLNVLNDNIGNEINRNLVIKIIDGKITSTDNWLNIKF